MLDFHTDIPETDIPQSDSFTSTPTPTSTSAPVISEDRLARPFVLLGIGLLVLVVCNFALAWALISATGKKQTFVQLNDGTAVEVLNQDALYRSEAVVQETTTQFLKLLWEWSDRLPGSQQADPGFTFNLDGQDKTIPTSVYYASQLTGGGIGNQLVIESLKIIPPAVFEGRAESSIEIEFLGSPRITGQGLYEIDVLATVVVREVGYLDQRTQLNKTFTWGAVQPYVPLLPEDNPSPMRSLIAQIRASGLQLVDVKPFNP
ncbi:MAG: hypothetical protein WBM32_01835 [Crocosphaera sp.]|jgi:hypothetical protein